MPWAKAMYDYKRGQGKSGATAFRCVARSVLRILSAMMREGIDYDDKRYLQALRDKGVPWAVGLEVSPTRQEAA